MAGVLQTGCFLCYLEDRFLYYDAYYSYCKIYVTVLTATVLTVCIGPVTFHLVCRPANTFSRQADMAPVLTSVETDKFCPCLMELNPGYFNVFLFFLIDL